jgi:hypothetical protein
LIRSKLLTVSGSGDGYIGERVYEDGPGEFTFTVPAGIRAIHGCSVGAGGQQGYDGGGGGGLGWANNIPVEPGEDLLIRVGQSTTGGSLGAGDSGIYRAIVDEDGEPVLDQNDNPRYTMLLEGAGGRSNIGGSFDAVAGVQSGGGRGGDGGSYYNNNVTSAYGSGAGAGGYEGNGGDGGRGADANSGGASGGTMWYTNSGSSGGTQSGAVGGGVGIRGRGTTAGAPTLQGSFEPARPGRPGSGGEGKLFGGGGHPGEMGGHGAVRIIWGIRFSYPDNADIEAVE